MPVHILSVLLQARRALETIFKCNVRGVKDGTTGAANGFRFKSGSVDRTTVQSEEIWTGSTYALASLMILEVRGFFQQTLLLQQPMIFATIYD